jgi:uncharacterized protein
LPDAIDGIFDQTGAMVVVIRVEEGVNYAATLTNIIGGVDMSGNRTGMQAFLDAESTVKVVPRILIATGFSHQQAIVTEMLGIADSLRAVIIADGENTVQSLTVKTSVLSVCILLTLGLKVWDTVSNAEMNQPASARVAGIISKSDNERGFWWSPSNREMYGILGTARKIDFALGDVNSRANYLNENEVTTIIHKDGYRLWGNRTCSSDPKWAFLSVVRTAENLFNISVTAKPRKRD